MYGKKQATKIKNNGLLRRPNPSSSTLLAGGIFAALLAGGAALMWKKSADEKAKKDEEKKEVSAEAAYGAKAGPRPVSKDNSVPSKYKGRPPPINL